MKNLQSMTEILRHATGSCTVLLPESLLCFDRRSRRQLISLLSVITFQKRECSRNGSSDDAMNKGNFLYILIMHETRHVRTQSNIG